MRYVFFVKSKNVMNSTGYLHSCTKAPRPRTGNRGLTRQYHDLYFQISDIAVRVVIGEDIVPSMSPM
jgi:hypothetical protein